MSLAGNKIGTLIVGVLLIAGLAHGATEDSSGTSVVTAEKSLTKRILEKTSFSYFGFVTGPAVTRLSNYGVDGATGKDGGAIGISNQFRANFGLTDKGLYIGPFITAKFHPTVGQTMLLTDSGARIGHTHLLKTDEFNWSADVRFLAPASQGSIDRGVALNVQSTHSMNYSPAGSRMTYGLFTSILHSFLREGGKGREWDLYFGPNLTYKTSDTVSFTTYFEIYPNRSVGGVFKDDPFDINPMVNFQVNKVLTLSPGVIYYPSLGTVESLSYMAYIFAAL